MPLHHGFSVGVIFVYLYQKIFFKVLVSILCKYNMNQNTCIKQICAIYCCFEKCHWKWLEVASDVFRALSHLSLETFTLQSGKYKAQIGSTADNLDEQHVCFYCLTGLLQRCLCDIFMRSNKLKI